SNGDVVPGATLTPSSGLQFDGGIQSGVPGDNLTITGKKNQGTTTYDFTSADSGSVMLSNFGTVYFTADESVLNSGITDNMVVNLPATASNATLGDDGISNGRSRISAATIVPVDFTTPNNLLTINA